MGILRQLSWLCCGLLISAAVIAADLKEGDNAPEFNLKDLQGRSHTLAELRANGPVLLYFWSVECGYCRAASPKVQQLHEERAAAGLTVAGIDLDYQDRKGVEDYVSKRKLNFLILHGGIDNADVVNAYGVPGTPTFVVVGRDGRIVYYGHSLAEVGKRIQ